MPGETYEIYIIDSDRARRIGLTLEPVDGNGPLRLEARLYGPGGAPVSFAPAAIGQPSLRDVWDLPGPGEYMLQLFGAETRARFFTLTVTSHPAPEAGGGEIGYGDTRSGEIAVRGQRDRWWFEGRAGDRVLITMLAPLGDAYLAVYDRAGRLLASGDDSARLGRDPVVEITLPADGRYAIVARMYGDDQVGAYRLALAQVTGSEDGVDQAD
jgi:hypothetical protein